MRRFWLPLLLLLALLGLLACQPDHSRVSEWEIEAIVAYIYVNDAGAQQVTFAGSQHQTSHIYENRSDVVMRAGKAYHVTAYVPMRSCTAGHYYISEAEEVQ